MMPVNFISKRFIAYFATLVAGYFGAAYIIDGVQLAHFYDFATTLFTVYVSGQTASDVAKHLRGSV